MEGSDTAAADMLKSDFEDLSGIKVNIIGIPAEELHEDLVKWDCREFFPQSIGRLYPDLLNLTQYIDKYGINRADFVPIYYEYYCRYDGEEVALPYDADIHLLFYRDDLLKRAELDKPPESWEDFLIYSEELSDFGYGSAFLGEEYLYWTWLEIAMSYGAFEDWNGNINVNSEECIRALDILKKLKVYSPEDLGYEELTDMWLDGEIAMMVNWQSLYLKSIERGLDVKCAFVPKGEVYAPLLADGSAVGINKNSDVKEASFLWLSFITSASNQLKVSLAGTGVEPAHLSILNDKEYQKNFPPARIWIEELEYAKMDNRLPEHQELMDSANYWLNRALNGMDSDEALKRCELEWNEILKFKADEPEKL